jgi:F-type H+-transporting ATPase subunit epsilon
MLPDKLRLEIVTPDHEVVTETVDEVILPSVEGYLGVRPGHAPLLARLDAGEISFRVGSTEKYLACSGGYAEVLADTVSVLAETAEPAEDIDLERAERARARAEERLKTDLAEQDFRRATVALKRAVSRIEVRRRVRG